MTDSYYRDKLAAEKLQRVYEVASPRVKQYLKAEVDFVLSHAAPGSKVLELGCGYGRIFRDLTTRAGLIIGIDNSYGSIRLAKEMHGDLTSCRFACMNAAELAFADGSFDLVICIQNGISAFHVDQRALIEEALRVTVTGGRALFSSYSAKFWDRRLDWFRRQAAEGLLGEIDEEATGDGVIVCKDGFSATTVSENDFRRLTQGLGVDAEIVEVDGSSLFCVLARR